MTRGELSSVIISEFGTDWADTADAFYLRPGELVVLVQWRDESPNQFARRAAEKLKSLQGVARTTLVCGAAEDRASIAARRYVVEHCLNALASMPGRELTLVCAARGQSRLPRWAVALAAGIEERDPALELFLQSARGSEPVGASQAA